MGVFDLLVALVQSPIGQWALSGVAAALTALFVKKGIDTARIKLIATLAPQAFEAVEGLAERGPVIDKFKTAVGFINHALRTMGKPHLTDAEMGRIHALIDMWAKARGQARKMPLPAPAKVV